jgi:hypothetical protein
MAAYAESLLIAHYIIGTFEKSFCEIAKVLRNRTPSRLSPDGGDVPVDVEIGGQALLTLSL